MFIGDFRNILAKITSLLAISQFYWRTGNSTRFFPVSPLEADTLKLKRVSALQIDREEGPE